MRVDGLRSLASQAFGTKRLPEVYLLGRWSFANSPYCNNNGLGNCHCLNTCSAAGWTGQLLGPCHSEHFDFGTPWQLPPDYLVNGGPLSPEVGWTARNVTLMAFSPLSRCGHELRVMRSQQSG